MISAWNLLWIIPATIFVTLLLIAVCSANDRDEEYTNGYNAGYKDGINSKSEVV